jgi:cobalt/nickel transport system permease protein
MHIPDGLLPPQVCVGGYAVTGLATWYSLRQINRRDHPTADVPKAALLTAAFFLASSLHVPIPPASVHLVLNGLLGVVLGFFSFPAILIGLFFQAVMFQHGGLTTLGVNAAMMGSGALLAYFIYSLHPVAKGWLGKQWSMLLFAFIAGAIGLGVSMAIFLVLVVTQIPAGFNAATEQAAIYGLGIAHVPLMLLEGFFTAAIMLFFYRVKPELLPD